MSRAVFPGVVGRYDMASSYRPATVSIDRDAETFSVRPFRRQRVYTLPLADVASWVVRSIIRGEMLAKKKAKKKPKKWNKRKGTGR